MEQVKRRELTAEERACLEKNVDEVILPAMRAGLEDARIRQIVREEIAALMRAGLGAWL